jgi:hypothetical protein
MKAAIVHESAAIDTLLSRIAASKLAHAEADDQQTQLTQALEAEDTAVLKVRAPIPAPRFFCVNLTPNFCVNLTFSRSSLTSPLLSCSTRP